MNEELNNALVEVIISATETAGAAKDFMMAEMPDVVNQLLWWHGTQSAIFLLIGLVVFLSNCFFIRKSIIDLKNRSGCIYRMHKGSDGGCWILLGSLMFASIIVIASCVNLTWLQILIAPKLYLIEYAAALVK